MRSRPAANPVSDPSAPIRGGRARRSRSGCARWPPRPRATTCAGRARSRRRARRRTGSARTGCAGAPPTRGAGRWSRRGAAGGRTRSASPRSTRRAASRTSSNSSSARSPNGPCTASYLELCSRSALQAAVVRDERDAGRAATARRCARRAASTSKTFELPRTVMVAIIPPPTDSPPVARPRTEDARRAGRCEVRSVGAAQQGPHPDDEPDDRRQHRARATPPRPPLLVRSPANSARSASTR